MVRAWLKPQLAPSVLQVKACWSSAPEGGSLVCHLHPSLTCGSPRHASLRLFLGLYLLSLTSGVWCREEGPGGQALLTPTGR